MHLPALGNADPRLDITAHGSDLLHAFPGALLPSRGPLDSPETHSPHPWQLYASRAGETPLTSHCVLSSSFSFLCNFDWGLNERKQ